MATKNLYLLNTTAVTPDWMGRIQDGGTAPTAVVSTFGWTVAKTSTSTPYWQGRIGATAAATTAAAASTISTATHPTQGTGAGATTAGDTFRSSANYTGAFIGTFAAGTWTFNFGMRCTTSSSQAGHINFRLWASNDPNGQTGVREITSGSVVCSTVTLATTTTTYTSTATPSLPSFTVNGDYLFLQVEWQETTAGGSNSCDVKFYISACTVVTADFQPIIVGTQVATDLIDTSSVAGSVAWPAATASLATSDPSDAGAIAGAVFTPVTATLATSDPLDASSMAGIAADPGLSGTLGASDTPDSVYAPGTPAPTSLLHFDSDFSDATGNHTWTTQGGITVSNTQSEFGGASALFDGSTAYLTGDGSSDFYIGTNDFTVDCWAYPQSTADYGVIFSWMPSDSGGQGQGFAVFVLSGQLYIQFNYANNSSGSPIATAAWSHIALTRASGVLHLFINGAEVANSPWSYVTDVQVPANTPILGSFIPDSPRLSFIGWIDEFRFIKGTAVWTANFSPPTASYTTTGISGITTFAGQVYWLATLAATDTLDAAAIAALAQPIGALAASETPDTSALAGTLAWQAALAATDHPDTSAIAGLTAAFGTLATTDTPDTSSIAGAIVSSGTLAATDIIDKSAITAQLVSSATLAASDLSDAAALAAQLVSSGTLATTDPADTSAIVASVPLPLTGTFAATDIIDKAAISALASAYGTLAASDVIDSAAIAAAIVATGFLAANDLIDTAAVAGQIVSSGSLAASEPTDQAGLAVGIYGTGTLATAEATDIASASGTVLSSLGMVLSVIELPDTSASAGTVTGYGGQLAATDLVDYAALSGGIYATGTLAAQDAIDVAVVAGGIYATGVVAATEVQDGATLAGGIFATGTLSATEPRDGAAIAATVAWSAALAANDNPDHAAFSGLVVSAGALAGVEAADFATGAGEVIGSGTLDASEPLDQSLISATVHAANVVPAIPGDPVATPPDRTVTPISGDRTVAPPVAARAAVATNGGRVSGGSAPSRVVTGSPPTRRAA